MFSFFILTGKYVLSNKKCDPGLVLRVVELCSTGAPSQVESLRA